LVRSLPCLKLRCTLRTPGSARELCRDGWLWLTIIGWWPLRTATPMVVSCGQILFCGIDDFRGALLRLECRLEAAAALQRAFRVAAGSVACRRLRRGQGGAGNDQFSVFRADRRPNAMAACLWRESVGTASVRGCFPSGLIAGRTYGLSLASSFGLLMRFCWGRADQAALPTSWRGGEAPRQLERLFGGKHWAHNRGVRHRARSPVWKARWFALC